MGGAGGGESRRFANLGAGGGGEPDENAATEKGPARQWKRTEPTVRPFNQWKTRYYD